MTARRLRLALVTMWDRVCTTAFWAVYRGSEIVPQIRMNHRDMRLLEQRIEKLESRMTKMLRTAGLLTDLVCELASDIGDIGELADADRK